MGSSDGALVEPDVECLERERRAWERALGGPLATLICRFMVAVVRRMRGVERK
jgi:hypothetical protein